MDKKKQPRPFIVLDTETNGTKERPQVLIQVAWTKGNSFGFEIGDTHCHLVRGAQKLGPFCPKPFRGRLKEIQDKGEDPESVLLQLVSDMEEMDKESKGIWRFITHNLQFDTKVLLHAVSCLTEGPNKKRIQTCFERVFPKQGLCSMLEATMHCKLPNPRPGYSGFKYPKLRELHACLFPDRPEIKDDDLHTADADTQLLFHCVVAGFQRGWYRFPVSKQEKDEEEEDLLAKVAQLKLVG